MYANKYPTYRPYQLLTKEQVATMLHGCAQYNHKDRHLQFCITVSDVLSVMQDRCSRTGVYFDHRYSKTLPNRASLDRIDNSIGYTPDNIQVVTRIYNIAKWTFNDSDVLAMAHALVDYTKPGQLELFDHPDR